MKREALMRDDPIAAALAHLANATALLASIAETTPRAPSVAPPVTPRDELLDVREAARRLRTSVDWLYRHADEFPVVRIGSRQLRFSSRGLEDWIAGQAKRRA
jgi:predicted DNA-binding transcriptional regulator AlpA